MRERYLQAMGIEVWRLRQPAGMPVHYAYTLSNTQQQVVGLLLADADTCDEAEGQLVTAIAKATSLNAQGGLQQAPLAPGQISLQPNVLILLGKRVADTVLGDHRSLTQRRGQIHGNSEQRIIVSYAPAQLLADKTLKAPAWKDIKMAIQEMEVS